MTSIDGTLTESLDPTDWVAYAHRIDNGVLAGMADVIAGGFSIDCGSVTEHCLVAVAPKMGARWKPGETVSVVDYRVPAAPWATPYLHEAVAVATLGHRHFLRNPTGHPRPPREQKTGDVLAFGGPRRPASAPDPSASPRCTPTRRPQ